MPRTVSYKAKYPQPSYLLDALVSGVWASDWAYREEEKGRSYPGQDLMELAPNPPRWALTWAKKLADAIIEVNREKHRDPSIRTLEDLYKAASTIGGFPRDVENFAFCLGMQAIGSGVHWADDARGEKVSIYVPSMEFYQGANPDLRFVHD